MAHTFQNVKSNPSGTFLKVGEQWRECPICHCPCGALGRRIFSERKTLSIPTDWHEAKMQPNGRIRSVNAFRYIFKNLP